MPRTVHHQCCALIATVLIAMAPASTLATVARVDFAMGRVMGIDQDGAQRRLVKHSKLNAGDTVITGRGRVQIRFTDGGYTALAPNTEFRIDEYQFDGEADQDSRGFFSLLKGGLRTITGLIGKLRKKTYRLNTPVATIGIRGTEFVATFDDQDGLSVTVGGGQVEVCSNTSCAMYASGETGAVLTADADPQRSAETTTTTPPSEEPIDTEYAQGDERNADARNSAVVGTTATTTPPSGASGALASGALYAASVAFANPADASIHVRGRVDVSDLVNASIDPSGAMVAFDYGGGADGGPISGSATGGFDDTASVDGVVGWGRWTGASVTMAGAAVGYSELHYAIGIPTVAAEVPTTGTATMAFVGGTPPALVGGASILLGSISPTSNLTVDFGANTVTANLFTNVGGEAFTSVVPLNIGKDSSGATRPRSIFGGTGITTSAGTACVSGCSTFVDGIFAGTNASHAGVTYKYQASDFSSNYVLGAAGFRR